MSSAHLSAEDRIADLRTRLGQDVDTRHGSAFHLIPEPSVRPAVESLPASPDVGLVRVFREWSECQPEILRQVTRSGSIRVFVQIGRSVLSSSTAIYNALERSRPDAEIRILHAGLDNPYLDERSANRRGSDYRRWQDDIAHALDAGERLRERLGSRLRTRQHHEGYIWRLFIFDEVAYVQPYLHARDNAGQAPVLKYARQTDPSGQDENPASLWHLYSGYFDLKWDECAPDWSSLADHVPHDQVASVVGLIERNGHKVFVVPQRYVAQHGTELPFHNVGGKRRCDEPWIDALQREATEEIGITLRVRSSAITRQVTTAAEYAPLRLADAPRPYCIYKRTKDVDPELPESAVNWIVGYEAQIPDDAVVEPQSEIAAVLVLSPDLVRRTAKGRVTYAEIASATDGSEVIVRPDVTFDFTRVAVPTGLAAISVLRWRR